MTAATLTDWHANRPGRLLLGWLEARRAVPLLLIVCAHAAAFVALRGDPASQPASSNPKEVLAAFMVAASTPPALPQPVAPAPPATKKPAASKPMAKPQLEPRTKPETRQPTAISPTLLPEPEMAPGEPASAAVALPAATFSREPAGGEAAAAAAAAAPSQPRTVSGVEYIQAPQPDYPLISKRMGEEGKVVLRVLVNQRGRAERVDVQRSSGSTRLDQAAQQAGMRAVFRPHMENGRPVAVYALVPINFSLD